MDGEPNSSFPSEFFITEVPRLLRGSREPHKFLQGQGKGSNVIPGIALPHLPKGIFLDLLLAALASGVCAESS